MCRSRARVGTTFKTSLSLCHQASVDSRPSIARASASSSNSNGSVQFVASVESCATLMNTANVQGRRWTSLHTALIMHGKMDTVDWMHASFILNLQQTGACCRPHRDGSIYGSSGLTPEQVLRDPDTCLTYLNQQSSSHKMRPFLPCRIPLQQPIDRED